MLISFSCSNFRSFKDEQTLTMEPATKATGRRGRTIATGHRSVPDLLTAAVIYGANSGGKSNLVKAIDFMTDMVAFSAQAGTVSSRLNVEPYRFEQDSQNAPAVFEISFLVDESLYQYGFAANEERIISEWMYETPNDGRIRHLFNREFLPESNSTEWYVNPRVKGEKKVWQESTRANALFLSTAVQLNSKDFAIPFKWLTNSIRVVPLADTNLSSGYTAKSCNSPEFKERMLELYRFVDPDVIDFKARIVNLDDIAFPSSVPQEVKAEIVLKMKDAPVYQSTIVRKGHGGTGVDFDLDDESTGATLLYSLVGPLLDVFDNGLTLVVDELDSGLHPLALRSIVSMFFDKSLNKSGAQLIMTCHESTLLRDTLLRADQVWFVEKSLETGSVLMPLSKYKPRQDESFFRGYLGGRYGGLPVTRTVAQ
jgi:uncharacterized protein